MLPTTSRLGILSKIAKTLRIGNAKYIVGADLNGNSYLELPSLSGSLDPRHTRRSIQWAEKRELGDYDQRSIPVQWVMWLRHTRREAPTIEELVKDRERILLTQANAAKLALEDQQRREREQQARLDEHEGAKLRAQQKLVESTSGRVPTTTVVDEGVEEQAGERVRQEARGEGGRLEQERSPDEDVWAASRARLAAKGQLDPTTEQNQEADVPESLQQAMDRRAARRAGRNDEDAERERARREMSKSPLDAFVPMPKARR
ncbi:NADH dehydrogenase [ubiquinone] 1 alpha subcomplex subunit [Pseudozyma hubeiensis]|nr:NADH dehydrogenase [ubiquinone] 1 alpha subcomplex subunit [Pseudozyma hubeiensis]